MAKKFMVMDFLCLVDPLGDEIPVIVKSGADVVCKAKSLRYLATHGMPLTLEARVRNVSIFRNRIELRIQPNPITPKFESERMKQNGRIKERILRGHV